MIYDSKNLESTQLLNVWINCAVLIYLRVYYTSMKILKLYALIYMDLNSNTERKQVTAKLINMVLLFKI